MSKNQFSVNTGKRPGTIAVASLLLIVLGILSIIAGGLIAVLAPSLTRVLEVNEASFLAFWGVISIILGVGAVISGWLLWNLKRSGAYIAVIDLVIGTLFSMIKPSWMSDSLYFAGLAVGTIFDILILVFIALGWNSLE